MNKKTIMSPKTTKRPVYINRSKRYEDVTVTELIEILQDVKNPDQTMVNYSDITLVNESTQRSLSLSFGRSPREEELAMKSKYAHGGLRGMDTNTAQAEPLEINTTQDPEPTTEEE